VLPTLAHPPRPGFLAHASNSRYHLSGDSSRKEVTQKQERQTGDSIGTLNFAMLVAFKSNEEE
jgi:hypothetical protein